MKPAGFLNLSSELRNRIYRIAANDPDRVVEKRVSRRPVGSTTGDAVAGNDFYRARGYYGLTQTCRLIRSEFHLPYLKDRAISVHIRDADDFLDAFLTPDVVASNDNIGWLSIRAEQNKRSDYPRKLRPLLMKLYNTANLQFRFTEGQGPSVFNNSFLRHHVEWKYALGHDIKHIDADEASHWGLRIVLNPGSEMPWVRDTSRAWFRILHISDEGLNFFQTLGLNHESDMIFIRRGTRNGRDNTSSDSPKRGGIDRHKLSNGTQNGNSNGNGKDNDDGSIKVPLLVPESRSMSFATSVTPSTVNHGVQ